MVVLRRHGVSEFVAEGDQSRNFLRLDGMFMPKGTLVVPSWRLHLVRLDPFYIPDHHGVAWTPGAVDPAGLGSRLTPTMHKVR